jgi:hypothetical protein
MSNTYNWTVDQLVCKPSLENNTNVVSVVHWRATATDGTNTVSIYNSTSIPFDDTKSFEAYETLNPTQVLNWVYENGVNRETVDSALDAMLLAKANPTEVVLPLPWSA